MDPAIIQPYEHLLTILGTFANSLRSSQASSSHAERWNRAATHLDQQLNRLRSHAAPEMPPAALKNTAAHLTQLARIQDGLRLEHSSALPPNQLADQRRLVVFAAWQLLQALDHLSTMATTK